MNARYSSLSMPTYAAAHFGKSLWWNGSELFLTFFLTEYLSLGGSAATAGIAFGLVLGAVLDVVIARRSAWFASVARAGRVQMAGAAGAAISVMVLGASLFVSGTGRWLIVILANLVFRVAYVFYDLPQNCLLGLVPWSPDQRRRAAAARAAAGAAALIVVSLGIAGRQPSPTGITASGAFVAVAVAFALVSATLLFADCRAGIERTSIEVAPVSGSIWWGLAMMAAVCLTVPGFGKLAPYLVLSETHPMGISPVLMLAIGTGLSQFAWPAIIRMLGEARTTAMAGCLLLVGGASLLTGGILFASLCVGTASGALATIIWSHAAIMTAGRDRLATAPAFAWLTATAKIALAVLALGLGKVLDATDYHHKSAALLPVMTVSTIAGGVLVLLLAYARRWVRPETHAG